MSKKKPAEPTIAEISRQFFRYGTEGVAEQTRITYRKYVGYFVSRFGHVVPSRLSVLEVTAWLNSHTTWKSSSTLATVIRCIKRLFNWAVRYDLIARNPLMGIRKPGGESRRNWTTQEFRQVVRVSPAHVRRLWYFMCWTGARPGEVRVIRWSDIDWDRHCVTLSKHKTSATQKQPRPRIIPLLPVTERLLRWLWRQRPVNPHVFLNNHAGTWTDNNLCCRLQYLREQAGLPHDVKSYGVRHLFATEAIRRDVDIKSLAEVMGHTTTRMTEKYTHLGGDVSYLIDAANVVNRLRKGAL